MKKVHTYPILNFILFLANLVMVTYVVAKYQKLKILNPTNFQTIFDDCNDVFNSFNEQGSINLYDKKSILLGEINNTKYSLLDSSYSVSISFLSFLQILKEIHDKKLIFNVKKLTLETSDISSPTIFINFTTLAYEKK
jgi:hypothetical protein